MVLGVEGFAGGMADQVAGEVATAVNVNFLTKPMKERLVFPAIEFAL